ncbi:hypothetical protein WMO40_13175 [Bacillaceae bacterium CLA-AA-H227]|uniref:Uncharacterized protein n=1 Tax=Robertmurraya yapensis (ex Hitch et al 2024) TaxID=3133160 RepID=A0ACC6SC52_9BACI|nr:hypothetical protein [Robertmurraya kyonggiensis]
MKKWILSATIYLLVVVGSYYGITAVTGPSEDPTHSNMEQHDN